MTIDKKIRIACAVSGVSLSELARRIGTTPQNLSNRLPVGKFSDSELEQIAEALGAVYVSGFRFPDGETVGF